MASVDSLLENGVTMTTEPGAIFSTSPPGPKNAGAAAGCVGYGSQGTITIARPATSATVAARRRLSTAVAAMMPTPRKAIAIRRDGSALSIKGRYAIAAQGRGMGVTLPLTWRCGPSERTAMMTVIRPSQRTAGLLQPTM